MSDVMPRLHDLVSRTRPARAAGIAIECDNLRLGPIGGRGIALIDRYQRGDLFAGRPRGFRVEPGEHVVQVFLAPRLSATMKVATPSGTIVSMRCGLHPEWVHLQRVRWRHSVLASLVGCLLAAVAWSLFPFVRELVACLALGGGVPGTVVSLLYLAVRGRWILASLAFYAGTIGCLLGLDITYRRQLRAFRSRHGSPVYLAAEAVGPTVAAAQPALQRTRPAAAVSGSIEATLGGPVR